VKETTLVMAPALFLSLQLILVGYNVLAPFSVCEFIFSLDKISITLLPSN
jgi:hypothetical protein